MTRLFYASTLFGAMTLAAAIDDGRFGPREDRRILLVSGNAAVPEVIPPLDGASGFAPLRPYFDEIHSWNEIVAPMHPSDWKARVIEVPMLSRLLAARLSLGDDLRELVLESVAVPPARTVAALVRDCPITVYSDGLMSYGPTRDPLPLEISGRITRLLHLDLVPGLTPLLLSEYGVPADALPDRAFLDVAESVTSAVDPAAPMGARETPWAPEDRAMILGQYLSALDILTADEEAELHADMLRGVVARGFETVLFKPHPAAGRRHALRLRETAAELGVRLEIAAESVPAESYFAALRPGLVVGCFSTALVTARNHHGLPVAAMGGEQVLERLSPYENSNRIPVTITDALLPRLAADGSVSEPPPVDLPALVRAVGYCMRAEAHPGLREAASAYLDAHGPDRYFKRQRLAALELLTAPDRTGPGTLARLRRRLSRTVL